MSKTLKVHNRGVAQKNYEIVDKYTLGESQEIFHSERAANKLLETTYTTARTWVTSLSNDRVFKVPELAQIAIRMFSLKNPEFFTAFNEATQGGSDLDWASFEYKGMWLILNNVIHSSRKFSKDISVYRGITDGVFDVTNAGAVFCFNRIISATENINLAILKLGKAGILFKIDIERGININDISECPKNYEYLIAAYDLFKIESISNDNNICEVTLKQLPLSHSKPYARSMVEDIEEIQHNIGQNKTQNECGRIFCRACINCSKLYCQCRKLCRNILCNVWNLVMNVCTDLGNIFRTLNELRIYLFIFASLFILWFVNYMFDLVGVYFNVY